MRLFLRHAIAVLLFFFLFRLAVQAQSHELGGTLPKSVLLSRLSESAPIPSRSFDQGAILKAIRAQDSERFVNRQIGSRHGQ